MTRKTIVLAAVAVLAIVFALGGYVYKTQIIPPVEQASVPDVLENDKSSGGASLQTSRLEQSYSPSFGPETAKVTIVEFFDPACEACRAFYPFVKQILDARPDDIRLVLRYAAFHEGSDVVVRMLEAARLQNKFKPVLEALLAAQPTWASHGKPNLDAAWKAAEEAGLDITKARKDMMSSDITARLMQENKDVEAYKVQKTPTFFVNGKPLPSFGSQQLVDLVKSELSQ